MIMFRSGRPLTTFLPRVLDAQAHLPPQDSDPPTVGAKCSQCDYPDESLEHILTDYPNLEALTIWDLLQRTCPPYKATGILGYGYLTPQHPPKPLASEGPSLPSRPRADS
jgi:hypothetical protein